MWMRDRMRRRENNKGKRMYEGINKNSVWNAYTDYGNVCVWQELGLGVCVLS